MFTKYIIHFFQIGIILFFQRLYAYKINMFASVSVERIHKSIHLIGNNKGSLNKIEIVKAVDNSSIETALGYLK